MLSRPTFMPTPWRKNDCVFIFLLAVLNKFTIKTYSISLREKKTEESCLKQKYFKLNLGLLKGD